MIWFIVGVFAAVVVLSILAFRYALKRPVDAKVEAVIEAARRVVDETCVDAEGLRMAPSREAVDVLAAALDGEAGDAS